MESEVLYPPIETQRFAKEIHQDDKKSIFEKISE